VFLVNIWSPFQTLGLETWVFGSLRACSITSIGAYEGVDACWIACGVYRVRWNIIERDIVIMFVCFFVCL